MHSPALSQAPPKRAKTEILTPAAGLKDAAGDAPCSSKPVERWGRPERPWLAFLYRQFAILAGYGLEPAVDHFSAALITCDLHTTKRLNQRDGSPSAGQRLENVYSICTR
jgi:hypothetical protein